MEYIRNPYVLVSTTKRQAIQLSKCANVLKRRFPKGIDEWPLRLEKCSIWIFIRKCKLKPQGDTFHTQ